MKSYMMLSVTIVLSFSLLLGYLVYSDSASYNKHKYIFCRDRNILSLWDTNFENEKVELLLKQVSEMENTYHYMMYEVTAYMFQEEKCVLEDGSHLSATFATIKCIPNRVWGLYDLEGNHIEVTYLNGTQPEGIVLKAGEALMDEITFQFLKLDEMEEPVYYLPLYTSGYDSIGYDKNIVIIPIKIVGTFSPSTGSDNTLTQYNTDGTISLDYDVTVYLSLDDFNMQDYPEFNWQRKLYFYSETPELISQAADCFSYTSSIAVGNESLTVREFTATGVYKYQNEALEEMQIEARTKAIIATAMVLLLGINLYSSFTNTLNDRKFEIGVKRSIGATSFDIIQQFLYESVIVMIANIMLSITLVTDIMIVYKVIYECIPDEWGNFNDWIIYVSPYSVAMFAICAVTLTVVFSLIFAYKSTQVEIVQYLKAE